jgi:hypothetical protein
VPRQNPRRILKAKKADTDADTGNIARSDGRKLILQWPCGDGRLGRPAKPKVSEPRTKKASPQGRPKLET